LDFLQRGSERKKNKTYVQRDGDMAREASRHADGSAGWAAEMFPGAKWVKAFSTVYFKGVGDRGAA
jgi:hypothetical protein